jgi:hypothetical protein
MLELSEGLLFFAAPSEVTRYGAALIFFSSSADFRANNRVELFPWRSLLLETLMFSRIDYWTA